MSTLSQDLDKTLALTRRIRSGYQPTDEEVEMLQRTIAALVPLIQAGIEAVNNVLVAFVSRASEVYNQLPQEVRQTYERGVERERSKAAHPAGKASRAIGDINAELRQSLQADLHLVPDGPNYMARRDAEIQRRISEQSI